MRVICQRGYLRSYYYVCGKLSANVRDDLLLEMKNWFEGIPHTVWYWTQFIMAIFTAIILTQMRDRTGDLDYDV